MNWKLNTVAILATVAIFLLSDIRKYGGKPEDTIFTSIGQAIADGDPLAVLFAIATILLFLFLAYQIYLEVKSNKKKNRL